MFTSLDFLIVVFMVLAALTLLSLCLMFLLRNRTAKKVCFYVSSVLGLYISWVGFRIGIGGLFVLQMAVGIGTALMCVGAFVLERICKSNEKLFLVARILSALTLVIGFANAFMF